MCNTSKSAIRSQAPNCIQTHTEKVQRLNGYGVFCLNALRYSLVPAWNNSIATSLLQTCSKRKGSQGEPIELARSWYVKFCNQNFQTLVSLHKYFERRGSSDSYSITKSRSTSTSDLLVSACGLSSPSPPHLVLRVSPRLTSSPLSLLLSTSTISSLIPMSAESLPRTLMSISLSSSNSPAMSRSEAPVIRYVLTSTIPARSSSGLSSLMPTSITATP